MQQEDGKLYLRDTGSVNGTFLNNVPVSRRTEIKVGDTIRLHLIELQIIDPTKAPAEPSPFFVPVVSQRETQQQLVSLQQQIAQLPEPEPVNLFTSDFNVHQHR